MGRIIKFFLLTLLAVLSISAHARICTVEVRIIDRNQYLEGISLYPQHVYFGEISGANRALSLTEGGIFLRVEWKENGVSRFGFSGPYTLGSHNALKRYAENFKDSYSNQFCKD